VKAVRFYNQRDIRIDEIMPPSAPMDDEVAVEVLYCGICGTDLHEYTSGPIVTPISPHPLTGATLPQTLGHEFSARVLEIGKNVKDVRVGDRVAIMPAIVCGRCISCRTGRGHLCEKFAATGLSSATGGLGEIALLKEYQVAKLPDSVSDKAGAVIEPAAVAAYGIDRVGVQGGAIVLVSGAGPIGTLSALYANAIGASQVIISEPNPERAAFARTLGLGPVLDPYSDTFDLQIQEITEGRGVDVASECSGSTPGLATCLRNVRRSGKIVQTGLHTQPAKIDAMLLSERDISIVGSWCFVITDWPRIIRLVASGKYPVEKVISSIIDISDAVTKGFDVLIDPKGNQMKVLVKVKQ
jgi:(R,R)-butanediol dehydrogenase/meso-butanediol dehydrogenase/diacetyl reductase